jgi:hypothetical protein
MPTRRPLPNFLTLLRIFSRLEKNPKPSMSQAQANPGRQTALPAVVANTYILSYIHIEVEIKFIKDYTVSMKFEIQKNNCSFSYQPRVGGFGTETSLALALAGFAPRFFDHSSVYSLAFTVILMSLTLF